MTQPLPPLAFQLLRAADWYDANLRRALVDAGFPELNQSHSRVFALLGGRGVTPSELARSIGMTRQSMQMLLRGLITHGLIVLEPDGLDNRRINVRLAARGEAMMRQARGELQKLERRMERHVGRDAMEALRSSLAQPLPGR
jgi:DNA-binding MarR family transcriptional regulator